LIGTTRMVGRVTAPQIGSASAPVSEPDKPSPCPSGNRAAQNSHRPANLNFVRNAAFLFKFGGTGDAHSIGVGATLRHWIVK
jgi:hypothetical protein